MWFTTVTMFAGSTALYSVDWAQMLSTDKTLQQLINADWANFYDTVSELSNPGTRLPIVSQYLPFVNVSL